MRHIQVVIGAGQDELYAAAMGDSAKLLPPVIGGVRRQDSVLAGLEAMARHAPDYVFIVDAARIFTRASILDDVIAALSPNTAVFTAMPVADTIKHQGTQIKTIARADHFLAQTPQAFPFAKILELQRELAGADFTDDVALFEARGLPVKIIPGNGRNFKITTQEDFQMAESLLNAQTNGPAHLAETRIGHGFDVHRFCEGNHVWLGGVKIPHTHGLDAHSDGDVALHALTDALLGAQGAGDIGQHFPPPDPQWKNASSDLFVRHAVQMLHAGGGRVVNADITILCEAPKVGPHRAAMQAKIAELLGVEPARVNVKATTTEKLGALGRGEGLAAEAVVSVKL